MSGVNSYKDGVVAKLYKGLQGLVKSREVVMVEGTGRLGRAKDTVEVDGTRYQGRHVVLASGSYSKTLPGLELGGRVVSSTEAINLDYVPDRVVVLGGGVIGVEFASVWKSFGSEVTIVEALPHLVPNEDEFLSKSLERQFRKRKIAFKIGTKFTGVEQTEDAVTISLENGEQIEADLLLVAVGRGPNTADLGYEDVGVTARPRLRPHRRAPAHQHRRRLRRRRHRPRPAARPPRLPAGHLRRRGDRGAEPAGHRRDGHPAGHLLRARGGVGRASPRRRPRSATTTVQTVTYDLAGNGKSQILRTAGAIKLVKGGGEGDTAPVVGVHMIGTRVGRARRRGAARLQLGGPARPRWPTSCTPTPPRTRRSARPTSPSPASPSTPTADRSGTYPQPPDDPRSSRAPMAYSVQMPALGESVTEGTITRWLKQEGDHVDVDEPLLEVSTDKVDTEIPSPQAGVLQRIVAQEDDTVEIGGELAVIGDESEGGGSDSGTSVRLRCLRRLGRAGTRAGARARTGTGTRARTAIRTGREPGSGIGQRRLERRRLGRGRLGRGRVRARP